PNFDTGRSQLDEALQEPADGPRPPASVPQTFPNFMGFPIVAMVEKINAIQVRPARMPLIRVQRIRAMRLYAEAMSARIADWMRKKARDVRISRESLLGRQTRNLPWH